MQNEDQSRYKSVNLRINMFDKAIRNNETAMYLHGHGQYFVRDTEYPDYHSVMLSWGSILNCLKNSHNEYDAHSSLLAAMQTLLKLKDVNLGLWLFTQHFEAYCYYWDRQLITRAFPENLLHEFLSSLRSNIQQLKLEGRRELYYGFEKGLSLWGVIKKKLMKLKNGDRNNGCCGFLDIDKYIDDSDNIVKPM